MQMMGMHTTRSTSACNWSSSAMCWAWEEAMLVDSCLVWRLVVIDSGLKITPASASAPLGSSSDR